MIASALTHLHTMNIAHRDIKVINKLFFGIHRHKLRHRHRQRQTKNERIIMISIFFPLPNIHSSLKTRSK